MRSVGRLVAELEAERFACRVARQQTVAASGAGVVWFPSCWRKVRLMQVARSAVSQTWVAAQQAHARDRRHAGC
jgi:hypothetical protein